VVELNKQQGRIIDLGLDAGKYRIINVVSGSNKIFESRIHLKEGETVELRVDQFETTDKIDAVARGDLKYQERRRVFKKRSRKPNFFVASVSRYTRAHGRSALMLGGYVGITFNKAFSIGFASFANTYDFPLGHPVYWGVTMEYALPTKGYFNLKFGAMVGSGEMYFLSKNFWIVEPQVSVTFNVTRLFDISAGLSYRIVSVDNSELAPFSLCFSLRLGK